MVKCVPFYQMPLILQHWYHFYGGFVIPQKRGWSSNKGHCHNPDFENRRQRCCPLKCRARIDIINHDVGMRFCCLEGLPLVSYTRTRVLNQVYHSHVALFVAMYRCPHTLAIALMALQNLICIFIAGTLGCMFINNETHENGVTKYTKGKAWSAFIWHHSSLCSSPMNTQPDVPAFHTWLFKMHKV